jgi:hypothetical protein
MAAYGEQGRALNGERRRQRGARPPTERNQTGRHPFFGRPRLAYSALRECLSNEPAWTDELFVWPFELELNPN